LLELINEYSKFIGYKINTQKSLAFLYTEKSDREIKKIIPFTIAAIFTIVITWKQPRRPSTDEWIKKLYIYTVQYYP